MNAEVNADDSAMKVILVLICSVISLLLFWVLFELRYMWFVEVEQARVLRFGIALFALLIVILWIIYPSRAMVAALGTLGLLFPPIINEQYVWPNLGFVPWMLVVIGFLVATTQLRRIQKRDAKLDAHRGGQPRG